MSKILVMILILHIIGLFSKCMHGFMEDEIFVVLEQTPTTMFLRKMIVNTIRVDKGYEIQTLSKKIVKSKL